MKPDVHVPETLLEVVRYFSDERRAFECVRDHRWPNGVKCPHCGSDRIKFMESRLKWNCNACRQQFTCKTKSIFEDSPLSLTKWIPALWLIVNAKNGISSYEVHRALGVTQKTAWFMLHRLRLAMQNGTLEKFGGKDGTPVEADETYIGGKARNIHKSVKERKGINSNPMSGKSAVLGLLERGGRVVTFHIQDTKARTMMPLVKSTVKTDSWFFTDANSAYVMAGDHFRHDFVDHAVQYVDGVVHTNGMENYWSLLKRTIKGTYVSVEPFHLHRYLDEQAFRFNERKGTDKERFRIALTQVSNKRIMYKHLTGKELAAGA